MNSFETNGRSGLGRLEAAALAGAAALSVAIGLGTTAAERAHEGKPFCPAAAELSAPFAPDTTFLSYAAASTAYVTCQAAAAVRRLI